MWDVFEKKSAVKNIDKLPPSILEKYEFWKSVVQVSGTEGLKAFSGFKDHALKGEWKGFRSSYLNDAFRVIYQIERNEVRIFVIDVNHHDYRRK
ncbi:MAG: type II toxin-antitoxin system mRNA interferase toxin, RelE/StbE family [Bdellovibrio sp.]|nr:type II toxin-antitoxin system mRNA interferase toxin, RelE/StbE family [Bdellovibrio sp.]